VVNRNVDNRDALNYLFIYFQYLLKMDHSVLVSLENIDTSVVYITHLSSKDAHKVETGK